MNVVIAAGGTGGHVYPALALAEEFCRQVPHASVTFVGTGRAIERTMLAGTTWRVEALRVQGMVGRGVRSSLTALLLLPGAIRQSIACLRESRANLVIGTGGYTSPPVVLAACRLGITRALVEPNAVPGLANRALGPLVQRIFVSFERAAHYFRQDKVMVAGTPLRRDFLSPPPSIGSGRINTVLACGGSQGANTLNSVVVEAVRSSSLLRSRVHLIHQTGERDFERVAEAYRDQGVQADVTAFVRDMAQALRRADLVIARCGAATLAEIAACGKPSILIPFPYATHDHQEVNARTVEQAGAGVVLLQPGLTGARLAQEIEALLRHADRVRSMAERSLRLRRTDAAETMVNECRRLLRRRRLHARGDDA